MGSFYNMVLTQVDLAWVKSRQPICEVHLITRIKSI